MKHQLKSIFIVTAVVGTLLSSGAIAQENTTDIKSAATPKLMFGLTGGLSSPMGNYTKTAFLDNSSGFAGSGMNFGATAIHFLNKNFGISALISIHQYAYSGAQNMATGFKKAFEVDSVYFINRGSHHETNILVGPYYTLLVSEKLSVDFRLLVGLTSATLAGYYVQLTDGGVTDPPFWQNAATATTFGMQAGAALHYYINKQFSVMLNADYFWSKPNFSIENVNRVNNVPDARKITSYNEAIAGINANITVAYTLWNN